MRLLTRTVALLLLGGAVAACGGRSEITEPEPDGGLSADGAPPPDSRTDGPGADVYSAPVEGLIYLVEIRDNPSGAQQGAAYAFFAPAPLPFFHSTKTLAAGCRLYGADEVGPVQLSAGDVTISGGVYPIKLETDEPVSPGDWLYPAMLYPDIFSQGTLLTVSAAGDEVPAFSGNVQGVGDLAVTLPSGVVHRQQPLTISFTTPQPGQRVWVVVEAYSGNSVRGSVRCELDGSATTFTVPAAAMSALPAQASSVLVGAGLIGETVVTPSAALKVHLVTINLATVKLALQ